MNEKCDHELEYHDCCDSVACKKCLRVWGGKEYVSVPVMPQYPQYPWYPNSPLVTYGTKTTDGI